MKNATLYTYFNPLTASVMLLALFSSSLVLAQTKPACLSPGSAAKHIDIDVYAGQDPKWADDNLCPGNPDAKQGDICVGINEKPDVRFIKKGADKGEWEFIDFQLSGDGVNWPGDLPRGAYSDFEFGSDTAMNTGRPYFRISGNSMLVQNNNCHEFSIHYRVTLKNTTSGKVVRLHPAMDNKGTEE